jgi:HK97 family phage portal protein
VNALDRILSRSVSRGGGQFERSWPVGKGEVFAYETTWGHDDSRFSPNEVDAERYMSSNDVYALLASKARLIQDVPLRFYKGKGSKKKEIESSGAVDLFEWVNPYWTAERLARMDEMSMGLWGETFWAIEPPSRESPNGEIWWLKPSRVRAAPHESNYLAGFWYESAVGQRLFFTADEIVWYRYPNPADEFSALPPLLAAKLAADTALAMMTSNRKLFVQGMQIAGVISPAQPELEFSEPQVDDLERHLAKRFTGPDRAHRWVVLRKEVKFNQMSLSPKDAEYIDGLNVTFRQVCRAFGMQPSLHGDLEQASPGDTDALERIEWARTLAPDLRFKAAEVREQYLKRHFVGKGEPNWCEYDFSGVPAMQEAQGAVWEREAGWMDRGLMTINEWRERHGLPPVPWGDSPWMPMNKGQFLADGEQPKGALVIPGQPAPGGPGVMQGPQDGLQGGPQLTDETGVPLPKPPDDEYLPVNQPERMWVSHWDARQLLASFARNGHKLNGHNRIGAK